MNTRETFEAWMGSPPYEREVERLGDDSAWPGSYVDLAVDLAWLAYSEATAAERERCAEICSGIGDGNRWSDAHSCADAIRRGE